jgi:hypothetical protein
MLFFSAFLLKITNSYLHDDFVYLCSINFPENGENGESEGLKLVHISEF